MNDTQRTALIEQTQAELEREFVESLRGDEAARDEGVRYAVNETVLRQDAVFPMVSLIIDDTELYNMFAALMHVPDAQAFVTAVSKAYAAAWAEEIARAIELENKIV